MFEYNTSFIFLLAVLIRNITIPGGDGRNSNPRLQRSIRPKCVSQGYHLQNDDTLRQGHWRLQQMHPQHRNAKTEIFTQVYEEICLICCVLDSDRVAHFYVTQ